MKVTINKSEFYRALRTVSKYSLAHGTLPSLADVRIDVDAEKQKLSLTCYDFEVAAQKTIDAEIQGASLSFCAEVRPFFKIVAAIKADVLTFYADEDHLDHLNISDDQMVSMVKFPIHSADEFNFMDQFNKADDLFQPAAGVIEAAGRVQFCASKDVFRPFIMNIQISDGVASATDGFRIGCLSTEIHGFNGLLPTKMISAANSLMSGDYQIYVDDKIGILKNQNSKIAFYQQTESFPDYKVIIPSKSTLQVTVESNRIRQELLLAALLSKLGGNGTVIFEVTEKMIEIKTHDFDCGNLDSTLAVETSVLDAEKFKGFPFSIAFNSRLLLDYVERVHAEKVVMKFNSNNAPGLFTSDAEDDPMQFVLMPMHLG